MIWDYKKLYERCVHETVDNESLSYLIYKKQRIQKFEKQVNCQMTQFDQLNGFLHA